MTIKIARDWATPLTIGVFFLMAATGLLMFFHLDSELQKTVHEWAGWLMVAAVALHAAANWLNVKRYLGTTGRPQAMAGVFVLALLATFAVPRGQQGPSVPQLAISAITRAPIAQVAPLYGKTVTQARAELDAVGVHLSSDEATLAQAIGPDRGKTGVALAALAKKS